MERETLSLVLISLDTDSHVYQSAAKLHLAIKLENVADVRTRIFKPTPPKIDAKMSDMSFHI